MRLRRALLVLAFLLMLPMAALAQGISAPLNMSTACGGGACSCTGTAGSCSIPTPTGLANNDLMAVMISSYSSTTIGCPSGWTTLNQDPADGGTNDYLNVKSCWKCASSEGSSEGSFSDSGAGLIGVTLAVYRGTKCPSNPFDASADSSHGSSTSPSAPGLANTATNNEWVLHLFGLSGSGNGAFAAPSGDTADIILNTSTSEGFGAAITHAALGAAGSTVGAVTGSDSTGPSWADLSATIEPPTAFSQQSVCPNGGGVAGGVCDWGYTSSPSNLGAFVCPTNTTCKGMVGGISAACSPGSTPAPGGSNLCSVIWNGSAYVED